MLIKPIDEDKIKILLTAGDMRRFNISYEELDCSTPQGRRALAELLTIARLKTGFEFSGFKLVIEAICENEGGCTLICTRIPKTADSNQAKPPCADAPVIYSFDDFTALCSACALITAPPEISALYRLDNRYLLIVNGEAAKACGSILTDYGSPYGEGFLRLAYINEHARKVIMKGAVERLRGL